VGNGLHHDMAVIGPGAVGSLVAARLCRAGVGVCLLDHRRDRAEHLAKTGITVDEGGSCWTAMPLVTCDPSLAARAAVIVVCVKAFDTGNVCHALMSHGSSSSIVLTLQNGLGNIEQLQPLKAKALVAGVTDMGSRMDTVGHVRCSGAGRCKLALASGDPQAVAQITRIFAKAGMACQEEADLQAMLWKKLIVNAAINPLTALFRITNGELLTHPEAAPLTRQIVSEAVTVANAIGIGFSDATLQQVVDSVCAGTALNRSSMLRDIECGRRTEIASITGAIIDAAEHAGIETPVNRQMRRAILEQSPS